MNQDRITRLREAVFSDLASVKASFEKALHPDGSNVFAWHGEEFWVDRVRRFVIPAASVSRMSTAAWTQPDSLPSSDYEASELLDIYCGEHQLEDAGSITKMWAQLIGGVGTKHLWSLTGAKVINLAISQPAINPAFGPLFWLALADDLGIIGDYSENFFKVVGPMIYLQIYAPERNPAPSEVRSAQVAHLKRLFPGSTDSTCEHLPDGDWAARCAEQLKLHQQLIDDRVFARILESIDADPEAKPFR
jgi:hypothetical protein